ncbi:MAG TPA: 50S ribosomal protein L25 [Firmicutes bacterium]|uniref:Large ribosomal subunit protein bL25 n=1 Tax=Capillibacterium thermochitinicola TaxID=2699427 RepID=A0A8J6I2D3_9FIRM|nr:50S ribosomal protein L25 [Capillibacterium thermochitinicola]MBA2133703.1 50S ribosomal protein L25 [Capillibacterium thermochitinicola]HHW11867.1 50S ribosomal protein L25 [Bacillota bacterium]
MDCVLTATVREETGKGAAHRLRREGLLPAVLYGETQANLSLNLRETQKYFNTKGLNQLINLQVKKGKTTKEIPVLVREIQYDPLKGTPLHVDFYQVSMEQKVVVKVPVVLVGEDQRENDGSLIETILHEVEVSCLPADIPAKIEVDVSGLTMNNSITVGDLQPPAGVEFVTEASEPVVVAAAPRSEAEAAPEEEAAEGAKAEPEQETE